MISVLFYFQFAVMTVLYCLLALPWFVLFLAITAWNRKTRERTGRFFVQLYGQFMARIGCIPWVRIRLDSKQKEELNMPAIFVFNHRSSSDPFLAGLAAGFRPSVIAAASWPMRLPFFGTFARLAGFIDILSMDFEALRNRVRELKEQGVSLLVFPEGTRSGNRTIGQFHGTFFRIAKDLNLPIIPAAITGNEQIPERGGHMKPGSIRIRLLPPVFPNPEQSHVRLKETVRNLLIRETAEMEQSL